MRPIKKETSYTSSSQHIFSEDWREDNSPKRSNGEQHCCSVCWHTGNWFTLRLIISLAPIQYDANTKERNPGHAQSPSEIFYFAQTSLTPPSLSFFIPCLYCIALLLSAFFHTVPVSVSVKRSLVVTLTLTSSFFLPLLALSVLLSLLSFIFLFTFPPSFGARLLLYFSQHFLLSVSIFIFFLICPRLTSSLLPSNMKSHCTLMWTHQKTLRSLIPHISN